MQADFNDENLVAYLDGELPPQEASAVEQAVRSSADLQKRVSALKTSWNLLGDLPQEEFNPELAQSTIEMVTMAIEKESQTWFGWLRKNRFSAMVLCFGLALLAGVANGRKKTHAESRDALQNLHVALETPGLKDVRSIEFLETLTGIGNLMTYHPQPTDTSSLGADQVIALTLAEREQWVTGLDDQERREVSSSVERFRSLTRKEQEKNKEILDYILSQEERMPELLKAIRNYHDLIERGGTRVLVGIEEAATSGSAAQVAAINDEIARLYELTSQDRSVILAWMNDLAEKEFYSSPVYSGNAFIIYRLSLSDADADAISVEDIESLYAAFTGRAAKLLAAVTDPGRRRDLLVLWVSSAIYASGPDNAAEITDSATLRSLFDKQPPSRQQQLYILPAEAVRKELLSAPAPLPTR